MSGLRLFGRWSVIVAVLTLALALPARGTPQDRRLSDALFRAAFGSNRELDKVLSGKGPRPDINVPDQYGSPPLVNLAEHMDRDNAAAVRMLLDHGARVNGADREGVTALMWAARDGHKDTMQLLLDRGADIDTRDHLGQTALMWAATARSNATAIIQMLLSPGDRPGADVNAKDNAGGTALQRAAYLQHKEVVELLLQIGARQGVMEATLLQDSAKVQSLLASGATARISDLEGRTPLMFAAVYGNVDLLRALLGPREHPTADVNAMDREGTTAVMWASGKAYPDVLDALVEYGADIDARDEKGMTALMRAANKVDPVQVEKVKVLLEKGADPNLKDRQGRAALALASRWPHYDLIIAGKGAFHVQALYLLLDQGARIDAQDDLGMTALMHAVAGNCRETTYALLNRGADLHLRDNRGRSALTWAAGRGPDHPLARELLRSGARVAFMDALLLGDEKAARSLLGADPDLETRGPYSESPLMVAAEKGFASIVAALLNRRVNVNEKDEEGMTALALAIGGRLLSSQFGLDRWTKERQARGRTEVVKALLAGGADPRLVVGDRYRPRYTPLAIAAEVGDVASLRMLLRAGADPSMAAERFHLPLELAVRAGSDAAVRVLLAAGADPKPAMSYAALTGQTRIVRMLLEPRGHPGVKVNARLNGWTGTALMYAAAGGNIETVKLLLHRGAKINLHGPGGETALMSAALLRHPGVVKLLLQRGASVRAKDDEGKTVLKYAIKGGRADIIAMLRKARARR
jgi:ankyrin repeat protein